MRITINTKNGTVSSKWNHYSCVNKYGIGIVNKTEMEQSANFLDNEFSVDLNQKLSMWGAFFSVDTFMGLI